MRQQPRGVRVLGTGAIATLGLTVMLLLAPATALAAYAPWLAQTSGTTQTLNGVSFVDADHGWAVGGGGTIRHTINGGARWTAQTSGTTQTLYGVAFADADNGWAVGGGGTILRTTNGGASWSAQKSGTTQTLYGVAFADAAGGWAVGNRGAVLHTANGGAKWTAQTSGTKWTLYGVACAGGDTCWAVGAKGTVLRSLNAGSTWTSQSAGTRLTLYAVAFVDGSNGWLAGGGGALRTTTNGGGAWTARSAGGQTLYALTRPEASRGWAAGSGGAMRVTTDGSVWTAQASGTTQTLRGLAARGARGWAVGGGGTILTYSPDLRAPVTTAVGLQADDDSGWRNTSQSVTLTAADTGRSGVAATYYTVHGGAQVAYAAPFSVSGQGSHRVTYWSVDQAGNAEIAAAGYVNIDTTPPSVGHDADTAWHATDVTVTLTADDAGGSGVAATEYRPAGTVEWLPAGGDAFVVSAAAGDGARTYEIRAADRAGNVSLPGSCTVKIDATAPTTTPTGLGDEFSGWTDSATTVSLATNDGAGSGVAAVYYAVNGGAPQLYTHSFTVSSLGVNEVTYWSVDTVGNQEPVRRGYVNIAAYYARAEGLASDQDSEWHNGPWAVTLTAGGTPSSTLCYRVDGGEWQMDKASPVTLDFAAAGHHSVDFYAKNAGGTSEPQTGYVNIDLVKPLTALATPAPTRWVNHEVKLTYKASDDHAGVAFTYTSVNDAPGVPGAEVTLPAPLTHLGDGIFVLSYWSVDKAGNIEAAKAVTVRIDTRRPTLSARYAASAYLRRPREAALPRPGQGPVRRQGGRTDRREELPRPRGEDDQEDGEDRRELDGLVPLQAREWEVPLLRLRRRPGPQQAGQGRVEPAHRALRTAGALARHERPAAP